MTLRTNSVLGATILTLLLLGGCGGSDQNSKPPDQPVAPAQPQATAVAPNAQADAAKAAEPTPSPTPIAVRGLAYIFPEQLMKDYMELVGREGTLDRGAAASPRGLKLSQRLLGEFAQYTLMQMERSSPEELKSFHLNVQMVLASHQAASIANRFSPEEWSRVREAKVNIASTETTLAEVESRLLGTNTDSAAFVDPRLPFVVVNPFLPVNHLPTKFYSDQNIEEVIGSVISKVVADPRLFKLESGHLRLHEGYKGLLNFEAMKVDESLLQRLETMGREDARQSAAVIQLLSPWLTRAEHLEAIAQGSFKFEWMSGEAPESGSTMKSQ